MLEPSANQPNWVQIYPYGVTFGPESIRPILVFKDKNRQNVLPVWLSPLDAGIAVIQSEGVKTDASPHNLTWKILSELGVTLHKCFFIEVKGHHQYVDLHFTGNDKVKVLRSRAEEVMSFCLSSKDTEYFCEWDYFDQCRDIEIEMIDLAADMARRPEIGNNRHPYIN